MKLTSTRTVTAGMAEYPGLNGVTCSAPRPIIQDCWAGGFRDARSLWQALEAVDEQPSLAKEDSSCPVLHFIWSCI